MASLVWRPLAFLRCSRPRAGEPGRTAGERQIPVWTERHVRVAIVVAILLLGAASGLAEGGGAALLTLAALAVAFVAAFGLDAWFGAAIGLAVAAGLAFVRQMTGLWITEQFTTTAASCLAVIAAGWSGGWLGRTIRAAPGGVPTDGLDEGVFGSLGLLAADLAMVRLQEEATRAAVHGRPLSLALVEVQLTDDRLDAAARDEVCRVVARVVESRLRDTDVPFALTPERIGAILPESDRPAALISTGRILEAISEATFSDRRTNGRAPVADAASIRLAVATLGGWAPSAGELLDAALTKLRTVKDAAA